jgi:hypothetical protein
VPNRLTRPSLKAALPSADQPVHARPNAEIGLWPLSTALWPERSCISSPTVWTQAGFKDLCIGGGRVRLGRGRRVTILVPLGPLNGSGRTRWLGPNRTPSAGRDHVGRFALGIAENEGRVGVVAGVLNGGAGRDCGGGKGICMGSGRRVGSYHNRDSQICPARPARLLTALQAVLMVRRRSAKVGSGFAGRSLARATGWIL